MAISETARMLRAADDAWRAARKAAKEHALTEFPVGAKVRWLHTFNRVDDSPVYRRGVVVEQPRQYMIEYDDFKVRMLTTGKVHEIKPGDLELDPED